jgi:membrane associated rhomboid family serine protease
MGLLDRDYYRDDEGGPIATWFRHGLVTKILVTIVFVCFIIQISTTAHYGASVSGPFAQTLSLNADLTLRRFEAWRLVTYAFLSPTDKYGLFPFLFNALLLWVAGHAVEERLGRERYLAFFFGSTILGGLAMVGATFLRVRGASPEETYIVSGAAPVTALLAFLTLQSPRSTLTFFHSLTLPVWVLLAVAIGTDVLGLFVPLSALASDGRHVTLAGDFGALMAAMMFHAALQSSRGFVRRRRAPPQSDPDLRIFREEPPGIDDDSEEEMPATIGAKSDVDEHLEAQLDAVLAKVAAHGQGSLTSAEREILKRASEVYRKRRR